MNITKAKLCSNCSEIYEEDRCPVCGGNSFGWVNVWLSSSEARVEYFRAIGNLAPVKNLPQTLQTDGGQVSADGRR